MKGYKSYKRGLVCEPNGNKKQYKENAVYEENEAIVCRSGMHFCANPLDVLDYHPLIDEDGYFSDITTVENLDEIKTNDNRKFCTKKLKIGVKLELPAFINAAIDFILEKNPIDNSSQLASSGNSSQLASSGYSSKLASSGNYSKLASSGYYSKLASSGYSSKLASSGYYSQLASSGDYSQLASSGDFSKLASSGDSSQLASSGDSSVVAGIGIDNIAKARKGSWITLAEWKYDVNKNKYIPVCVKSEQVDGEKIKEDTFYKLENGEFVEVE